MTLITYKPIKNLTSDLDRWIDSFWNFDYTFNDNADFNPHFDINEDALLIGSSTFLQLIDDLLIKGSEK